MQTSSHGSASASNAALESQLAAELNLNPILVRCLVNRGIHTADAAQRFLFPKLSDLDPPDQMADLPKAVKRLSQAVVNREPVALFGDYDVDGLTSLAILYLFLRSLGCAVEVNVADRFSGGYGLSRTTVERVAASGGKLLVVSDCGSSDHDAIALANQHNIDVLVLDHHRIESHHPDALAFVNPHRSDCLFPDKNLCAAGLVFYFCAAVRTALAQSGHIERTQIDMRQYLDLVALGTIADVMPLVGNNRILAFHGLRTMSETRRPGIEALLHASRVRSRQMQSCHVSFYLAPRINAAGRLASAEDAFHVLVSDNAKDAESGAAVLERLTHERREIEEGVSVQARAQAKTQHCDGDRALVLAGEGWHKGVLGIVAARLGEEFSCPAFIIAWQGDEGTGSARGQGQFNLYAALKTLEPHLLRYGGHWDAAGFSLKRSEFGAFKARLQEVAQEMWHDPEIAGPAFDAKLNPSQLTPKLLQDILQLGPFGHENPEPVFRIVGLDVLSARVVGTNHLKLELKTPSGSISAFGPRMGASMANIGHCISVLASLSPDEWRGDGALELRLVHPPEPCASENL